MYVRDLIHFHTTSNVWQQKQKKKCANKNNVMINSALISDAHTHAGYNGSRSSLAAAAKPERDV